MPSTSPRFMSGEYFRKSVAASNGIVGGVCAKAAAEQDSANAIVSRRLIGSSFQLEHRDAGRGADAFVIVRRAARNPSRVRTAAVDPRDDGVLRMVVAP